MRVLIVEDETFLAEAVQQGLKLEAIAADIAHGGATALEMVEFNSYDVVILDRDLPGVHGDEVCRWIVQHRPETRVLMLTAARLLDDTVEGLAVGADDYMTKPFDFVELLARVHALHRRSGMAAPPILSFGGLTLDPFRREVFRDTVAVKLARKEFAVLEILIRASGGVVSAETLLEKAWDENADPFSNAMKVTISGLRKRLGAPSIISTVVGAGYRMEITP